MPLVAVAVCPHPPVIVPEIAGAAAAELDDLRTAADAAVGRLAAAGARTLLVIGADDGERCYSSPYIGSFARWGAPTGVALGAAPAARDSGAAVTSATAAGPGADGLPLSLLVGAWLLSRADLPEPGDIEMRTVAVDAPTPACAELGARINTGYGDEPWALLVMGDASACRGEKAPGYLDPRAEAYDDGVAAALAGADRTALLSLDPALSTALRAAGRAPWQVLAGAAEASGGTWRGDVSYQDAPYGVTYLVANWTPA